MKLFRWLGERKWCSEGQWRERYFKIRPIWVFGLAVRILGLAQVGDKCDDGRGWLARWLLHPGRYHSTVRGGISAFVRQYRMTIDYLSSTNNKWCKFKWKFSFLSFVDAPAGERELARRASPASHFVPCSRHGAFLCLSQWLERLIRSASRMTRNELAKQLANIFLAIGHDDDARARVLLWSVKREWKQNRARI